MTAPITTNMPRSTNWPTHRDRRSSHWTASAIDLVVHVIKVDQDIFGYGWTNR